MSIDKEFWTTLAFTVINILVLYFILKKILFKPVSTFMNNRTSKIDEALKNANEAKEKMARLEEEQQEKLKEIKEEGMALMSSYQKKANDEYNKIIEKAKEDSNQIIENTKQELETEKAQLIVSLKEEFTSLVLEASKKVLNKNIDNQTNRKLVDDFINEK